MIILAETDRINSLARGERSVLGCRLPGISSHEPNRTHPVSEPVSEGGFMVPSQGPSRMEVLHDYQLLAYCEFQGRNARQYAGPVALAADAECLRTTWICPCLRQCELINA